MSRRQALPLLRTLAVLQRQQAELAARCYSSAGRLAPALLPPLPLPLPTPTPISARTPPHHQHHHQQRWYAYGSSSSPPPPPPSSDNNEAKDENKQDEQAKAKDGDKADQDAAAAAATASTENDDDASSDSDDATSEHKVHALAAGGGPMRANLEAWLVAACLNGTSTTAPPSQGGGCTFLALAPRPQLQPLVWAQSLLASLTSPMRRALERRGEALVQAAIERDFSAREFCEGCSGAFESVMCHYGRGRWDLLAQMASPAVVASMRAAWDDLRLRRGLEPIRIEARASRISLAAPNVWRKAAVARLDPERAAENGGGNTVPWWAAVAVEVEATVDVALGPAGWREEARARRRRGAKEEGVEEEEEDDDEEDEDADADPPPATLERSSTRRVGYLVFARGPLPRSAAPALYSPWWLIGWY